MDILYKRSYFLDVLYIQTKCNEYKLVERENKKGLQEKSKEITSKCPIHNLLNQIYERQIFDS